MSLVGELTRQSAQEAARQELSRPEYAEHRPSLLSRVVAEVGRALGDILDGRVGGRLAWVSLVAVVLVFASIAALVVLRLGPLGPPSAGRSLFTGEPALTAADHRAAALVAAQDSRWADAVRERLRAVVRELEARGVLDERPGRTAAEVAGQAGVAVPALANDLRAAADTFDEIWYGGRTADRSCYERVVAVDERVLRERLVTA